MATDGAVVGVDLKTQLNSSLIALQQDSSLNISPELRDIIVKADAQGNPTDWVARLAGTQEWSVDHSGLLADSNDDYDLANGNATLKLEVDTTDDGTDNAQLVEIPLLDSIDLTLTQQLATVGGISEPLWRYLRPDTREFEISINGTYIEPTHSNGAVYDELLKARDNGISVPFELTVFGKTFTGNVVIGPTTIEGQTGGEDATIDMTLASDLDLAVTGSFGGGLDPIFTAFMNKSSVDVGMLHYSGSSPESGTKKFTGSGYYSEVGISLAAGEEMEVSGTVEGDGPLSMGTVS